MRNPIPAALAAAAVLASAAACSSSPAPAAAAATAPVMPAAYARAIASMARHCTQDAARLRSMVGAVHGIEVRDGVTDESLTALAGHLATVVAAYGKHRVSCISPFSAYATMRTSG